MYQLPVINMQFYGVVGIKGREREKKLKSHKKIKMRMKGESRRKGKEINTREIQMTIRGSRMEGRRRKNGR